jgi:hypothetical protein
MSRRISPSNVPEAEFSPDPISRPNPRPKARQPGDQDVPPPWDLDAVRGDPTAPPSMRWVDVVHDRGSKVELGYD